MIICNLPFLFLGRENEVITLTGELPNARLAVIGNAGHVPHEESPAPFMDAVRNFLSTMDQ